MISDALHANPMPFKGCVQTFDDLPSDTSVLKSGDVYYVLKGDELIPPGATLVWTGRGWEMAPPEIAPEIEKEDEHD